MLLRKIIYFWFKFLRFLNQQRVKKAIKKEALSTQIVLKEHKRSKIMLSFREMECLSYLARGYSAKEVAKILGVSSRTVEYHLQNIKLKTGLRYKSDIIKQYGDYFKTQ